MGVIDDLKAARDLIADVRRWTTDSMAKTSSGWVVSPRSHLAICWCALGALTAVCEDDGDEAESAVRSACRSLYSRDSIVAVNDDIGHDAILAAFDKAISDAEAASC